MKRLKLFLGNKVFGAKADRCSCKFKKKKSFFFLIDVLKKAGEGNGDRNENPFRDSIV